LYDLAFVEPGPLPPHERTWRHPSELGPTKADIEAGSSGHLAALAVGTLAVIAVAGLVIAMTPRTSSSPIALSATTTPVSILREPPAASISTATAASSIRVATAASSGLPRIPIGALLTSFSAFPHAVTSGPQLTLDGTDVATRLPDDHDIVLVRTEAVTYQLPWGEVPFLGMPDGSVVFDGAGALVAHVAGGELVRLLDD
jgi:hypothetical protein